MLPVVCAVNVGQAIVTPGDRRPDSHGP